MPSLSFDPMVRYYDETRVVDSACLSAALDYLVARFPPATHGQVVEPGIGTGRLALPLAQRGYRVAGVDISPTMLAVLRERLAASSLPVRFLQADATALPFRAASFDWGFAVHLFYFISRWQAAIDELLRVVKPGGPLVFMHTGYGLEVPALISRYRALCARRGHRSRPVGVRSTSQAIAYAESRGCTVEIIDGRWQWTARVPLEQALHHLSVRAYSFCAHTPEAIHQEVLAQLRAENADSPPVAEVRNGVTLAILTTPLPR